MGNLYSVIRQPVFRQNLIRMTQQPYSHQSMSQTSHRLRQTALPRLHSELTARKMAVIAISALVLPTILCTLTPPGGMVTYAVRRRLPHHTLDAGQLQR